ncbi:hypothetical protein PG999_000431 [Apiospora kogelbergensis]|uniref:Uncharacterized protein n=1 Tax=Apiospora kogelbergensis TaxID=1337665 RepID=A0AAW0RBQ0_9PEZI
MAKICLNRPDHTVIGSIRTETSPGIAELQGVAPTTGSNAAGSITLVGKLNSFILPAYSILRTVQNYLNQSLTFIQKEWLTVKDIHPGHVHSGPGNWLAKRLGLDQAPVTTIESASAVLNTIDVVVREEVLGKLISSIDGKLMPW